MGPLSEMFSQYEYMGMVLLLMIQTTLIIATICMIRRLRRHIETIQNKVTDYLTVVMAETEPEAELPKERVVSEQERRMVETLAKKQQIQKEEIFNAVLQEFFP